MMRTLYAAVLTIAFVGCGSGGGGGGGNSGDALFAGPLMYVGAQMRIYGSANLQLADFNNDGFPELLYEPRGSTDQTVFMPGSESELFGTEQFPNIGINVVVADFDADGNLDIFSGLPLDIARGNPVSDRLFVRGNGDNTFAEPVPLNLSGLPPAEGLPGDFAVGDINADGFEDILAQGFPDTITPLLNQGDATFVAAPQISVPDAFSAVFSEDLNRDTFDDIIRYRFGFDEPVDTYLSLGDGTFGPAQTTTVPGTQFGPFPADLNNDGNHDLLGYSEPGIVVVLGAGDGTFSPPILTETVYAMSEGQASVIADFNKDGNLDLVIRLDAIEDSIYLTLGNGDGTFDPNLVFIGDSESGPGAQFSSGEALDVDRDGNLDLLIAVNDGGQFLRPYFGNGDGTFRSQARQQIDTGNGGGALLSESDGFSDRSIRPLDMDGDGNLDLVIEKALDIAIAFGNGDLTFEPARRYPRSYLTPALSADLDADGDIDFFGEYSLHNWFNAMRNYGGGELSLLPGMFETSAKSQLQQIADFDQDGLPDLSFWFFNNDAGLMYNLGDMQFEPMVVLPNATIGRRQAVADVTGDGYPDILWSTLVGNKAARIHVLPNGPGRTFGAEVYTEFDFPEAGFFESIDIILTMADFNGDDRADALWRLGSNPKVFRGESDGTFTHTQDLLVQDLIYDAKAVNLDDDADLDLVIVAKTLFDGAPFTTGDTVNFHGFLNTGSGEFTFASRVSLTIADIAVGHSWDMADVNGDDYPDAVVYSNRTGFGVALGEGDGTFRRPNYFRVGGGMNAANWPTPVLGDFDNDGDADFAVPRGGYGGEIEVSKNLMIDE